MLFAKISHSNCLCWDSEGICFNNEIIMCCYVRHILRNMRGKVLLSIEIYVLCNSLAMCMDITETYDDMIGLRLLLYILYMCKAEKRHLSDRVEIRWLGIKRIVVDVLQKSGTNIC